MGRQWAIYCLRRPSGHPIIQPSLVELKMGHEPNLEEVLMPIDVN
jgi:hypothetical protein